MPESPKQTLFRYIYGNWFTMVVFVYAELGIADYIRDGAVTTDTLARKTDSDLQALARVLDCARVLDLHTVNTKGELRLTPTGQLLRSDVPASLRAAARLNGVDFRYHPWGELLAYVRTGSGQGLSPTWEHGTIPYLHGKPDSLEMFEAAMSQLAMLADEDRIIAELLDWGRFPAIVDIGSGNGTLLEAILVTHPDICGTLFDVPEVIGKLPQRNPSDPSHSRLQTISGNFFEQIPDGFDAYLMKNIIHNHPETRCLQILRNIANSMVGRDARLFLFEFARQKYDTTGALGCFTDLNLNLLVGGSVRSTDAYRTLLNDAGLQLISVTNVPGSERVILESTVSSAVSL
ncbi:MAG TPA: methyltransferase [Arenicellales bacterium]|nr:methyltransferase [Arenicellales bacterium]